MSATVPASAPVRPPVSAARLVLQPLLLAALALGTALAALCIGSVPVSLADVGRALLDFAGLGGHAAGAAAGDATQAAGAQATAQATALAVLVDIRIPRVLLAGIVGGGLAVSGVVFQAMLRNALADPYILGLSGGASAGALIAIHAGWASLFVGALSLFSFLGAAAVAAIVFHLGTRRRAGDSNALLLTGVMISTFLSAVILGLIAVMGDTVRTALFWLIGYLGNAGTEQVVVAGAVILPAAVALACLAPALNILSLGEEAATHLGLRVRRTTMVMYAVASLATATAVSVAGSIGFVGLIVPHLTRRVAGADHRLLLPSAFFAGAIVLIAADTAARSILAPLELPAGAMTAAIGAPLFLFLLLGKK